MLDRHLEDETVQALLDGELAGLARMAAALHLRRCGRCRAAVEAGRATASRARELLDRAARAPRRHSS